MQIHNRTLISQNAPRNNRHRDLLVHLFYLKMFISVHCFQNIGLDISPKINREREMFQHLGMISGNIFNTIQICIATSFYGFQMTMFWQQWPCSMLAIYYNPIGKCSTADIQKRLPMKVTSLVEVPFFFLLTCKLFTRYLKFIYVNDYILRHHKVSQTLKWNI